MTSKAKWFTYMCGARFRARIKNSRVEYRKKFLEVWLDAGTVTQARKYAAGKNPYGLCSAIVNRTVICDHPKGPDGGHAADIDAGERLVMRRILKSFGLLEVSK